MTPRAVRLIQSCETGRCRTRLATSAMKLGGGVSGSPIPGGGPPRRRLSRSVNTQRSPKIHQPACTTGAPTTTANRRLRHGNAQPTTNSEMMAKCSVPSVRAPHRRSVRSGVGTSAGGPGLGAGRSVSAVVSSRLEGSCTRRPPPTAYGSQCRVHRWQTLTTKQQQKREGFERIREASESSEQSRRFLRSDDYRGLTRGMCIRAPNLARRLMRAQRPTREGFLLQVRLLQSRPTVQAWRPR